jgi:hypothetical protein
MNWITIRYKEAFLMLLLAAQSGCEKHGSKGSDPGGEQVDLTFCQGIDPMRIISKREFVRQLASRGLDLDERYPPPRTLVFPATRDLRWSWEKP